MTHLRIEQNNGIIEEVFSEVIEKLYNIVHDDQLDNTSNLIGRLHTSATYQDYIDYLEDAFKVNGVKQLIIDATKKYVYFVDPEVNRVLANRWGDGNGVTLIDMASVTALPNSLFQNNKAITSFNELNKFINIISINAYVFKQCSALTSIDLSNITSIGNQAFQSCSLLTSVGDTSNLISIDNEAFNGCSKLTSIDLSNVTTIGPKAFYDCLLLTSSIDLSNVTTIGDRAFQNCSLLASIENLNCTSIGNYIFKDCSSLTTVDLSNVTFIGNGAFQNCSKLTSINLSNVISISNQAFASCSALISVGDMSNVTTISNQVFQNCSSLTTVGDLSNVTSIGTYAFQNCSLLTSVDLSNVTSIGRYAFENCSSLISVDLSNVTTIDSNTFRNCNKLTTLDLSNVTSIGDHAFSGCTSLTQFPCDPSIVTQIWDSAFENCTNMGQDTILELNLTQQIKCPQYAFYGTKFKGLILHWPSLSNLTFDGRYNIWENMQQLEYLDMSDTIAPIFDSDNQYRGFGFYQNPNITTAIFPETQNYLSNSMFTLRASVNDNTKYKYLILLSTTPPHVESGDNNNPPSDFFRNRPALNIYVPDSALSSYLSDSGWLQLGDGTNNFNLSDRVKGLSQLPAGVWTTGLAASKYHFFNDPEVTRTLTLAYAVEDGVALTNSDIASIISNDGYTDSTFSFKNNTDLVDFSDLNKLTNVTWLNYEAFDGCTSLQNINLSNIVNLSYTGGMIENYTFRNCSSLEYIYLPNATGSSLYNQCQGCTSLKLYIAPNVTGIGRLNGPFVNCLNLKGIFIPKCNMGGSSADQWHEDSFIGGCENVKVIDVDIITSINEHTFRYNTSLSAVIFRNTTTVPTLTGETSSYFSNITFYVDDNMLSAYQADSAWSNANIHLDVISNFVLADHLDSDTLTLYNSIVNPY